mgnify:CR=1 FL=1
MKVKRFFAQTMAEALKQVGISPAQATTPENGPVDVGNDGQQPIAQPTQPTQQGPSSPQREAAVKEIGAALGQLKDAQSKGDFTAYGQALDRLNKAVQQYESLPAGN